jgi:ribosomal protein S11
MIALIICAGLLNCVSRSSADGPSAVPERIAQWVEDLNAAGFAARREAAQELVRHGTAAVAPVLKAAQSGDLESALRCLDVLAEIARSNDPAARDAAGRALKDLTGSREEAIAERARQFLDQNPAPDEIRRRAPGAGVANIQVQVLGAGGIVPLNAQGEREVRVEEDGRKIEIRETPFKEIVVRVTETIDGKEQTTETRAGTTAELLRKDRRAFELYRRHVVRGEGANGIVAAQALAFGGQNAQVQVTNVNGERTIKATENGRRVEITDRDGKDITVRVTGKVDGKDETREYKAAGPDELKQKHPDAAKLYEQYANGAGVQIQVFGFNALPVPAVPQLPQPQDAARRKAAHESIERALKELDAARSRLGDLKARDNADKDALDKVVEQLRSAEKSLFEAQGQLER